MHRSIYEINKAQQRNAFSSNLITTSLAIGILKKKKLHCRKMKTLDVENCEGAASVFENT